MNAAGMEDVLASNQSRDAREVMRPLIIAETRREGLAMIKQGGLQ